MTTLTAQGIQLRVAEPAEMLAVLRQSYRLWGSGMTREHYKEWMLWQTQTYYWRKNVQFLVGRADDQIVSSCKLHRYTLQSRGRRYTVGGIGAVYTMQEHRGRGHASRMLEHIEEYARQQGFSALLLFSDIDPIFYEQLGYRLLPDGEMYLFLNDRQVEEKILRDPSFAADMQDYDVEVAPLSMAAVEPTLTHFRRYAASLPLAIERDYYYWKFKLGREFFIQQNSTLQRPALEWLHLGLDSPDGGYAIFEQFDKIMRLHEVVGRPEVREIIWRSLLRAAVLRRVQLIRGWEGVMFEFAKGAVCIERDRARPMLLPLCKEAQPWLDMHPCPFLELDHF